MNIYLQYNTEGSGMSQHCLVSKTNKDISILASQNKQDNNR